MKYYEVEGKANNIVLKRSYAFTDISEAIKECSKHFNVLNIHEISESRYMAMKLALRICCSISWEYCRYDAFVLCSIAGLSSTWDNCNGNKVKEYKITCQAAKDLDVSIGTLWEVKNNGRN